MPFHVYVDGEVENDIEVTEYAHKILNHFFKGRIKRDIYIDIDFYERFDDNMMGYCYGDHNEINIEISNGALWDDNGTKKYVPWDIELVWKTVAHELVHAKQYIRKEIKGDKVWRGKDGVVDCSNVEYHEQPWEIEAHALENELYEKYWRQV